MNDERLGKEIGAFYRETDVTPPDSRESARQVSARLKRTPQVRRRRWLPAWRLRATGSPDSHQTTEHQPTHDPAADGRVPAVIGRTQTMFSPVKAMIGGALVFALGGVLLIAQPFDQPGGVPGAEPGAEPAPPVKVTITVTRGSGEGIDEGCTSDTPEVCTSTWPSSQWSATDPRLSGTATTRAAEKWWPTGGDFRMYPVFEAYAFELVNDEGRWVGTGRGTGPLGGLFYLTLTGEGPYAGHSAVVTVDPSDSDDDGISTNLAVIVEGELPPFPEPIE